MKEKNLRKMCPAMKRLFAFGLADNLEDLHTVGSPRSGFTYREGVPPMYMSRTGKKVVRADVNGIVRMMSQSGYFNASGGYYTFDPAVSAAIGGYPYGAILRWKDPSTGYIRVVRSLRPDNTADFVSDPALIDGENWAFADEFAPDACRPRVFPIWDDISGWLSFSLGDEYTARRPGILYIQGGANESECVADGNSEILVWANVREAGATDFHAGGLLAYIPPVNAGYQSTSQSAQLVDPRITQNIGYTSLYSPGYVALWLMPGDTVNLSANIEMSYTSKMRFVPLAAADEMGDDSEESGDDSSGEEPTDYNAVDIVYIGGPLAMETGVFYKIRPQSSDIDRISLVLPSRAEEDEAREIAFVVDWPYGTRRISLELTTADGEVLTFVPAGGDDSVFLVSGVPSRLNYFRLTEVSPNRFMVYSTHLV